MSSGQTSSQVAPELHGEIRIFVGGSKVSVLKAPFLTCSLQGAYLRCLLCPGKCSFSRSTLTALSYVKNPQCQLHENIACKWPHLTIEATGQMWIRMHKWDPEEDTRATLVLIKGKFILRFSASISPFPLFQNKILNPHKHRHLIINQEKKTELQHTFHILHKIQEKASVSLFLLLLFLCCSNKKDFILI